MKRILFMMAALALVLAMVPVASVMADEPPIGPIVYIETLYLSNTLGANDGYTQLYEVVLDDVPPKADLIPLPNVGWGDGIIPLNHADAIACTPDGTKIYAIDDQNSSTGPRAIGVYDLAVPSWTTLGVVKRADGTTDFRTTDQAAFASNGTLYVTRNEDDSLYWIDIDPLSGTYLRALLVGVMKNGAATVDVTGADIVFDENDDCYLWTTQSRAGAPAGLYKFAQPTTAGDINATFLGAGTQAFTGLAIRGGGAVANPLLGSRTDTDAISIIDVTNGALGTQYPMYLGGVRYNGYIYGDMTVGELAVPVEPELYDICGFKYADWEGDLIPLPGWEIELFQEIEGAGWVSAGNTTTNENGAYCFTELEAGNYTVSETLKDGWDQLYPESGMHEVTLPYEGELESFDFVNTPKVYCYDETAWAYGEGVAQPNNEVEGNTSNAWGWTNNITGNITMDLYAAAGQNDLSKGFLVGTVTVDYDGDCVTVTYELAAPYTLAEVHLWVGQTPLPLQWVARGKNGGKWVPTSAPGQFPYHIDDFDVSAYGLTATIRICPMAAPSWVAAHAVVEWCEYDSRAMEELLPLLP